MNALEHAQRQAAWVWASQTLGIETTPERLSGLVELTEGVRVENLKPALKAAMQTNQSSFLPAVHLVVEAANRIAGKRRESGCKVRSSTNPPMTRVGSQRRRRQRAGEVIVSEEDFDLRVISLGAGVQSSALYRMAALGEIDGPMPDVAIFADTQSEPPWVYETLDLLESDHGDQIPIVRPTVGNLAEDLKKGVKSRGARFASVPFWMEGSDGGTSLGLRQCTGEYKINVVRKEIRRLLGVEKGKRAAGKFRVEQWIGISIDEVQRAKPSRDSWIENRWPLLYDVPMRRSQITEWFKERNFPVPGKSACTFCPYRQPIEYARMREDHPEVFEEACRVDDLIRSSTTGKLGAMREEQFVWRALKPLREIPPVSELDNHEQIDMFNNECEGMCGV